MKHVLLTGVLFLTVSAEGAAHAQPSADDCALPKVEYIGDLGIVLGKRAIEAINLAAGRWPLEENSQLAALILPDAEVSLGAGDVGRPLGFGPYGLRRMVREMHADSYRKLNWDYIPTPVGDPCGEHKVEIEFTDSKTQHVFPVTFVFKNGVIASAKGWTRSFASGPITKVAD